MEINPSKTKVMISNDPMKRKESNIFYSSKQSDQSYYQITRIRYLGVISENKHSYKAHVDMIVDKANKCLFTLITINRVERFRTNITTIYIKYK